MKALVYRGPGLKAIEDRPKPEIKASGDAIVKMAKTTICGTDLHILKGDVATCVQNIAITTRLIDTVTTPMPLKTVQSKKIDPARLITQRFALDQILETYDTLEYAAQTQALKSSYPPRFSTT